MDTKLLDAFLKLYEKRSLRQAAAELYISPQGLSRLLQNLECALNTVLFHRTAKGLEPTESGDYFYPHAQKLVQAYRQIHNDLQRMNSADNELSFVCGYGCLSGMPYSVLMDFQRQYPAFRLKWREFSDAQAKQLLLDDAYELALLVREAEDELEGYESVPLFSRKVVLLVYEGHPLFERQSVCLADIRQEPIIMEGPDFAIYNHFRSRCIAQGFAPNIIVETGDISFCHKLCEMKQGLSLTVDFVADIIQLPAVRAIPFSDADFVWTVSLVRPRNRAISSPAKLLHNYLLARFRDKE